MKRFRLLIMFVIFFAAYTVQGMVSGNLRLLVLVVTLGIIAGVAHVLWRN